MRLLLIEADVFAEKSVNTIVRLLVSKYGSFNDSFALIFS